MINMLILSHNEQKPEKKEVKEGEKQEEETEARTRLGKSRKAEEKAAKAAKGTALPDSETDTETPPSSKKRKRGSRVLSSEFVESRLVSFPI